MPPYAFEFMFTSIFVLVIAVFVVAFTRMIRQWNKNNRSPRLTVPAKVVAKRTNHSRSDHTTTTRYFVTFEVESGDRMELMLMGTEFGMLVEGDFGKLSFQGTRYLNFERI